MLVHLVDTHGSRGGVATCVYFGFDGAMVVDFYMRGKPAGLTGKRSVYPARMSFIFVGARIVKLGDVFVGVRWC